MNETASPTPPAVPPLLIDIKVLAALLMCSTRHVRRMYEAGRMPAPVKHGALLRWRLAEIESWIAGGCKPVRQRNRA